MFKALSSETRREMLKLLIKKEMHISALAKQLGISVPVAAKHIKILEEKDLVKRKKFGRSHVIIVRLDKLYELLDDFKENHTIKMPKGSSILDVLKEISGVTIERIGDREYLTSIDGEDGYYIYEVDGIPPNKSINKFTLKKNSKVELKKFILAKKKEIKVNMF